MKRILTTMLVLAAFVNLFAGCTPKTGGPTQTEQIDRNRTQLYVSNYNGGIGTDWLYDVKARFEEAYKDECFEPGTDKRGVQILVNPNKDSGTTLTSTLPGSTDEVFFAEDIPYYDWVSKNMLADLTDIFTSPAAEGEEAVQEKLTQTQREMVSVDGKYYALPHYDGVRGLQYDVDLFERKMLYFSRDSNNGNNGFVTSATEERSLGPDGKTGVIDGVDYSLDDGLPSTYDEFFALCDYMVQRNVTPFIWTGMYDDYTLYIENAIFDAYSTETEASLTLTFDSGEETVRVVTGFDSSDKPVIENVKVTEQSGYYVFQLAGRYYGLDFLQRMLSDKQYYSLSSTDETFSHLDAQEEFIYSSLENEPIAMLMDGNYWENEAKGAFSRSVSEFGERAENRRFAWMPLPRGTQDGKVVMRDNMRSYAFINATVENDPDKFALAKTFLRFCYSDAELQNFTVSTGVTKAIDYTLTQEQEESLSYYAKSFWNYRKNAQMIYNLSSNAIYKNNETTFTTNIWRSAADMGYVYPINAFRSSGGVSTRKYFEGMWLTPETWTSRYRQYFTGAD